MMMDNGFAEDMAAQEDLSARQFGQEGWIGRIKAAMAGDEKAEPFQFKPQVLSLATGINLIVSRTIE